ncbi:MAG: hypothetical protein ACRYHQ_22850 [Janthinobacterium lividum]
MTNDLTDSTSMMALTQSLPELKKIADACGKRPPKFRTVYGKLLDGEFPGEKIGNQWFVRCSDLGMIAERLGLVANAPARSTKSRKAASETVAA